MKLTSKARSAVTALADLAAQPGQQGPVPLRDIAERQKLSVTFLEQIFSKLRKAGLVASCRGAGGGYTFATDPKSISVSDVVRAMDEEIRSTACRPGVNVGCRGTSVRCLTHGLWHDLDRMIDEYLEGVTLDDIASQAARNREGVAEDA
ncbi:MAG: RrF2 family transcriptional regulator [Pseudomonadota bacterium]